MSDDAIATALAGLTTHVSELMGEISRLREILAEGAANGPPPPPPRNDFGRPPSPPRDDPSDEDDVVSDDGGRDTEAEEGAASPPEPARRKKRKALKEKKDAAPLIGPHSSYHKIEAGDVDPSDQNGWRAMGECIGSHKNLRTLVFDDVDATHNNLEALLMGVRQNRTVSKIEFNCRGEWPLEMLEIFFRDNQSLETLAVCRCCESIISSLSTVLRGCTSRSLERIHCFHFDTGEEEVTAEFIEALAGLPRLKTLGMYQCNVGRRGCGAVAALLRSRACMLQKMSLFDCGIDDESLVVLEPAVAASRTLTGLNLGHMGHNISTHHGPNPALQSFAGVLRNPTSMLKTLYLHENDFGDDEMISFADALAYNHRLEKLVLDRWHTRELSDIGFAAMTRALCNTSSIASVHGSNHTLRSLSLGEMPRGRPRVEMPNDLRNYLRMNERESKSLVAREKILLHFFRGDFSMAPFHENEMIPNALPHLLGWIGKAPDQESITALFNFFRRTGQGMPAGPATLPSDPPAKCDDKPKTKGKTAKTSMQATRDNYPLLPTIRGFSYGFGPNRVWIVHPDNISDVRERGKQEFTRFMEDMEME